jgi:small-conductance mechanosensitive channel
LLFGWVAADVVCNKIDTTKIKSKHLLAMVTKAVILIFTIAIALEHIGINVEILKQTFLLLLSAAALGVGLAIGIGFGLGMKDDAKKILRNIGKKIK